MRVFSINQRNQSKTYELGSTHLDSKLFSSPTLGLSAQNMQMIGAKTYKTFWEKKVPR